jgi:hypothetical protein
METIRKSSGFLIAEILAVMTASGAKITWC